MGIADYGVSPSGGGYAGYTYSTSEWWADANLTRLLANDGSSTAGHGSISFQLNVVVKFHSPVSGDFAYWIQDVAEVDTIGKSILFVDNIWNMSAAQLNSASVSGNGSVYTAGSFQFYADQPTCQGLAGGYPGNCVALRTPSHVTMRVTTGNFNGAPHVTFQYFDPSAGWVTYDNASFGFARGFTDAGFVVDGTQYTPIGIFYNAEFDYTGPSGVTTMTDRNSSMQFQLEYWNGHNLEAPSNAFNFGGNTAEEIQNVIVRPHLGSGNGSLGADVSTGSGGLAMLYDRANVSLLNVSTPFTPQGTLSVGGESHPYVGSDSVLTLAPGSYSLVLANATGVVNTMPVTLTPGEYLHLVLGVPATFPVTVREQGLPTSVPWTLHLAAQTFHTTNPTVSVNLSNGTYAWSVDPLAGYMTHPYSSSLLLRGTAATLWVNFTRVVYQLLFSATGLPTGAPWSVTVGGQGFPGTAASIAVAEPNGTYTFTVEAGPLYAADPGNGVLNVTGSDQGQVIGFSLRPGYLTGGLSPSAATLEVAGLAQPTSGGAFNLSLPPGVYTVRAYLAGFTNFTTNATVTAGNRTVVSIVLHQLPPSPGGGSGGSSDGGLTGSTELLILVAVAAGAVVVVAAAAARRRR